MFKGLKIVITGASRGVGYEAAKILLEKGAQVIGVGRDLKRMQEREAELQKLGDFTGLALNVADMESAKKTAEVVAEKWGLLDALVNNAGILKYSENYETEEIGIMEESIRINLLGPHQFSKALLPLLLKGEQSAYYSCGIRRRKSGIA